MIKYRKMSREILSVCLVVILGFFFAFNNSALAVAANFPQNTIVQLTVGGALTNFIIAAGSTADSVLAQASSLAVTISSGETFTFQSSDMKILNNNGGFSYSCNASNQTFLMLSASSTTTITITPSSSTVNCIGGGGGGSSGGGGGGGGGGYVAVATPTPAVSITPGVSLTPTPVYSVTPAPIFPTPSPVVVVVRLVRKTNDSKVYVQKSDGTLTWVKTSQEFDAAGYKWSDVKVLSAKNFARLQSSLTPVIIGGKIMVLKGIKFLNVRFLPSSSSKIVGRVSPGDVLDYTANRNGWYKINSGWVFGKYVTKI